MKENNKLKVVSQEELKNIREYIKNNIRFYRKKKEWSQFEFSEKVDVSERTVNDWERGISLPSLINFLKISELFGCSLNDLLSNHRNKTLSKSTDTSVITLSPEKWDEKMKMTFANNIHSLRGKMKQCELEEHLDMPKKEISRLENFKKPSLINLIKISIAFDISCDDLITKDLSTKNK